MKYTETLTMSGTAYNVSGAMIRHILNGISTAVIDIYSDTKPAEGFGIFSIDADGSETPYYQGLVAGISQKQPALWRVKLKESIDALTAAFPYSGRIIKARAVLDKITKQTGIKIIDHENWADTLLSDFSNSTSALDALKNLQHSVLGGDGVFYQKNLVTLWTGKISDLRGSSVFPIPQTITEYVEKAWRFPAISSLKPGIWVTIGGSPYYLRELYYKDGYQYVRDTEL